MEHESGYANTVTESGATADADSPIDDIEDTESRAIDLNTNEKNNEKCIEDAESGAVDLNRVSEKGIFFADILMYNKIQENLYEWRWRIMGRSQSPQFLDLGKVSLNK